MSSPYVDLMARIPIVAAKTAIGTDRLQEAQNRVGLSDEAVARLIPVSTKTWWRWKKAGEVPTVHLRSVARALHLEYHDDPPLALSPEAEDAFALIESRLRSLEELVSESVVLTRRGLELLAEIQAAAAPRPRRRASG